MFYENMQLLESDFKLAINGKKFSSKLCIKNKEFIPNSFMVVLKHSIAHDQPM